MTREMASHVLLLSSSTFASVIFRESNYRCAFSLPFFWNRIAPFWVFVGSVPQSLLAADKAVGLRCTTPPSLSTCAQSSGSSSNYSAIPSDLLTRLSGSRYITPPSLLGPAFSIKCFERSPMNYIPFDECSIHFQAVQSDSCGYFITWRNFWLVWHCDLGVRWLAAPPV